MRRSMALALALLTALAVVPGTGAAAAGNEQGTGTGAHQPHHHITLVTGDRVRVALGSPPSITVLPAPGREGTRFRSFEAGDRHYLIPLDAMPAVQSGRVDRRLFDLTSLVEFGYTDARRDSLPLLLTLRPGVAAATVTATGLTAGVALPAASGVTATVAKRDAAAVWKHLSTAAGVQTVWLDGLRRPTLEHSVPQIGAPAAHAAGYTGTGVRIAVLDTGVDATHPDLAGRVAASRNFTEESDGDRVGHGTHVASTAVGTGAASDGRYRGVAYDATVLDGKVCEEFGCRESAIIAGMEWAAGEGADVVNLSLGGPDTPGEDPVEAALNRLTAEHGTLFVVAAGNAGSPGTVGSPSTAEAALSVGAVDRDDVLAPFSSRGPTLDGAIKPEVTAPGVDIVAARATGTGTDPYVAFSGTSMATPHVAGAAALLAQQHPDWTPDRLRSALVGSARTMPDAGVYDQGGGRVDLARAVEQDLLATPATIGLGRQLWPHHDDEPVRRGTTITNTGTTDVTLDLRLDAAGPGGAPAPTSMFTVDADRVTVPAGGSATVGVIADTRPDGPDGQYGGWLVATGPGVTLTVPVAVDKEVESYDVAFDWRGFDGSVTAPLYVLLIDTTEFRFHDVDVSGGPTTIRLPARRGYLLDSLFEDVEGNRIAHLLQPSLDVTGPTSVMLDARTARPMRSTVPDRTVERILVAVGMTVETESGVLGGVLFVTGSVAFHSAQVGSGSEAFSTTFVQQWAVPAGEGDFSGSPRLYAMAAAQVGRYWTGFERSYRQRDFAQVHSEHHGQRPGRDLVRAVAALSTEAPGLAMAYGLRYPLPSSRTEYLTGENLLWSGFFSEFTEEAGYETDLSSDPVERRAGRTYTEHWNQPVLGPGLPGGGWVGRYGDLILAFAPMRSDRARHAGIAYTGTARTALYRDGVLVGELPEPGGAFPVPPEAANYRLEIATDTGHSLSGRTSVAWTFRSETASGSEFTELPATAVWYAPPIDDAGSARGGRLALVPVGVERQSLPASDVRGLTVEVSYDDGATWRRVPLVGPGARAATAPETEVDAERLAGARWLALVDHPDGPGHVSLRATGADRHGNTFEQTILRAYTLR